MNDGYSISYTSASLEDIRRAHHYIAFSLREPGYASKATRKILDSVQSLCYMPERFSCVDDFLYLNKEVRRAPAGNFLILYIVDNDKKCVTVVRICHTGQDTRALINEIS